MTLMPLCQDTVLDLALSGLETGTVEFNVGDAATNLAITSSNEDRCGDIQYSLTPDASPVVNLAEVDGTQVVSLISTDVNDITTYQLSNRLFSLTVTYVDYLSVQTTLDFYVTLKDGCSLATLGVALPRKLTKS